MSDIVEDQNKGWFQKVADKANSWLQSFTSQTGPMHSAGNGVPNEPLTTRGVEAEKGAHLKTVNKMTPAEVMAREARLEAQANARKPMAVESYRGAVKDMSTGKFDHRVDAAERVAKGYAQESVERGLLHNKIRNGSMSEEYKQAIKPPQHDKNKITANMTEKQIALREHLRQAGMSL